MSFLYKLVDEKEKDMALNGVLSLSHPIFEFKGSEVYSDHEQKNLLEGNITDQKTNYDNYLERGSEVTIVLEKDDNDNYYFVESIVK